VTTNAASSLRLVVDGTGFLDSWDFAISNGLVCAECGRH
jgi:hypothetical protein